MDFWLLLLCAKVFGNNVIWMDLSAVSSAVSKSAMNIAFFDTQIECLMKKMFLPHISNFCKLCSQNFTVRPPTGLFYRKRPPQQNGDRRKRHRTECTRMRPWWRSPRRLRVPGHAGRVTLSRHIPPLNSTFTQDKISDFQEKRLKSMTASF